MCAELLIFAANAWFIVTASALFVLVEAMLQLPNIKQLVAQSVGDFKRKVGNGRLQKRTGYERRL